MAEAFLSAADSIGCRCPRRRIREGLIKALLSTNGELLHEDPRPKKKRTWSAYLKHRLLRSWARAHHEAGRARAPGRTRKRRLINAASAPGFILELPPYRDCDASTQQVR